MTHGKTPKSVLVSSTPTALYVAQIIASGKIRGKARRTASLATIHRAANPTSMAGAHRRKLYTHTKLKI